MASRVVWYRVATALDDAFNVINVTTTDGVTDEMGNVAAERVAAVLRAQGGLLADDLTGQRIRFDTKAEVVPVD